jgi:transposase
MIPVAANVRIWIATGHTDMRKGMQGLALLVQEGLGRDPFAGDVFVFRGRGGSLIKALWHDGVGQAAGPWAVCLARDGGRRAGADRSADELSAGGDRLA